MKKFAILLFLLFPSSAFSEQYALYTSVVRDISGEATTAATITVYLAGTNTAATIYSDNIGTVKSNPFQTNSVGSYSFFAVPGLYKIVATKVGIGIFTVDQLQIGTADHADRHETGGEDEIALSNMSGQLPDAQKVEVQSEGSVVSTYDKINFSDSSSINFTISDGTTKSNVTAAIVSGSVTSDMLGENSVGNSELADSSVSNDNVDAAASIAESKLALGFPTHSNANDPSSGQKSALAGTFGTPGDLNRYVTSQDSRMADSRSPLGHASSHTAAGTDEISVAVSQITGENADTDLSADLEEETHATEHQDGAGDEISVAGLSGELADAQKVQISVGGITVGSPRPEINLIEGSNVDVLAVDNVAEGRVDVTISSTGGVGSPIILDLGDDSGDDSVALAEIATENDDYRVFDEESADKLRVRQERVPPYRQYDPLRPPATCHTCDEFTGNATSLTWTWGNQGTAAVTYDRDEFILTGVGENSTQHHAYTFAAPGGAGADDDFTAYTRITCEWTSNYNTCAFTIITTGTQASPTQIILCAVQGFTSARPGARTNMARYTNYTTFSADIANDTLIGHRYLEGVWLRFIYDDSADTLACHQSLDGDLWVLVGTQTGVTADPVAIGFSTASNDTAVGVPILHADFVRVRTDAAQSYPSDD